MNKKKYLMLTKFEEFHSPSSIPIKFHNAGEFPGFRLCSLGGDLDSTYFFLQKTYKKSTNL